MTVRVRRTVDVEAPPERVWEFIADPERRASAISVVADYELGDDEGRSAVWHVRLPIPLLDRTVKVRTKDVERRPPEYVKFQGRSKVMHVTGEHTVEPTDEGTRLVNEFVVEGRLPGVERFFKRNLDGELRNLETALRDHLELEA
jgi:carbon monoxide dehydrogenase subunit G